MRNDAGQPPPPPRHPVFDRIDWLAFVVAAVISFSIYLCTLAPTVTLEDSGELAVAGDYLGVPHPPGYPIWTVLAWVFSSLFSFVEYRGQPNPAWSIGLMSAVFGALAAGMASMLICRSGRDILAGTREAFHSLPARIQPSACMAGGLAGSLLFALSPVMWSQSVIIEVYSLNAFFLMWILLLSYRWLRRPCGRTLGLAAFIFGVGLTNYQVLLLAAAPLAILVFLRNRGLFRDFALAALPFLAVGIAVKQGALPTISHPTHLEAAIYIGLDAAVLTLCLFLLPNGRIVATTLFCLQAGLAVYCVMPLVSDLRNPPMNWGYPRTWEGFLRAITREQYEALQPANIFSARFLDQIGAYFQSLRGQFTLPAALFGFLPFTAWQIGKRKFNALDIAIGLCLAGSLFLMAARLTAGFYGVALPRYDKVLIAGVFFILGTGALLVLIEQLQRLCGDMIAAFRARRPGDGLMTALLLGTLMLLYVAFIRTAMDLSGQMFKLRSAPDVAPEDAATAGAIGYVLLALVVVPPSAALVTGLLMRSRAELRMALDTRAQHWLIFTATGFLIMSLFLIVLANPEGDALDNFVQRVKFISSHGFFALWIGYGLIFFLARAGTLFPGRTRLFAALLSAIVALSVAIPLAQNTWNRGLIRLSGGAEQNGHDFGWQFGHFSLRGSDAIAEELAPREEPLPNPFYPEPMEESAVFFGGSDAGRFVPTYMVYSARVRSDVHVITQNALADKTYLNVIRDLYGDRLWVPAAGDNDAAFQTYVNDVRAKRKSAKAELVVGEDGQVSVRGILGIMQINALLAEDIFEHNRDRHAFYVEESFPIEWMFPHLIPHGLIMKMHPHETALVDAGVQADADFWDWYTRRLLCAPGFLRDIAARKSFAKLRTALGGVLAFHGRIPAAERAFAEARLLYPLSAEACVRLIQDLLIPGRRFDEAEHILAYYLRLDPNNQQMSRLAYQLQNVRTLSEEADALVLRIRKGENVHETWLRLISIKLQLGKDKEYRQWLDEYLTTTDLDPEGRFKVISMLHGADRYDDMKTAITVYRQQMGSAGITPDRRLELVHMMADAGEFGEAAGEMEQYVSARPGVWQAWLDLTYLHLTAGASNRAVDALREALRIGQDAANSAIAADARFQPLLQQIQAEGTD